MTVAEFCADPANSAAYVCEVKLELDGQSQKLSDTSLSLSDARAVADSAMAKADEASAKADEARSMAQSALLSSEDLSCKTMTILETSSPSHFITLDDRSLIPAPGDPVCCGTTSLSAN